MPSKQIVTVLWDLAPKDVAPGSNTRAWWICAKGHEWRASIYAGANGCDCQICAGRSGIH